MEQIILRSGTLSVVNCILCYAGPYLGFIADVLGLSLRSFRRLHASVGTLAVALAVFHAAMGGAAKGRLDLHLSKDVFALISIICLCAQVIPLALRSFSYEAALRIHQIFAFALAYDLCGAIKVTLHLSRPLKVNAGQYINLWVPGASLRSTVQTHPFTVISWSEKPQKHLDLFIEPRGGFTKHLSALSKQGHTMRRAMFSGPHGKHLPIHSYENVVMLATGFGIAAHLPYLRKLIHDQNSRATSTRRIHLVWQIEKRDVGIAAQKLLNEALDEDKLDGEYNLHMSIFIKSENIDEVKFGDRVTAYPGEIPLAAIVTSELQERRPGSRTVISVSTKGAIRGALNDLLWQNRRSNIDIMYTDYQP
ncbi:hypothetical protein NQ176_g8886 [Zarea fungicola]|uniref:Uncharacterized protein n=1 Tax=Zarea fungicola TaxID=93591 RepID=A0ACC1MRQ3_9HYPO|nr:hypothetical protein NQ176_g8886 [Lecanicillium fungicola]